MPLPPALAARLRKRGILTQEPEEEVIAESYDDDAASSKLQLQTGKTAQTAPGCPNKYNPYHLCSPFCFDHWGDGIYPENRLASRYLRRRNRMLKKYPLPHGWIEVYDAGVGHHYYWSTEGGQVSWLSPTHPKAIIGEPASRLAKATFDKLEKEKQRSLLKSTAAPRSDRQMIAGENRRRKLEMEKLVQGDSDEDGEMHSISRIRKQIRQRADLDPMDPASYGDLERGKWTAGLQEIDEAKTGVDTTANGPLFQMRPYPSPGAILRVNAKKKGAK